MKRKVYTNELICLEFANNCYPEFELILIAEQKRSASIIYVRHKKCKRILKIIFNNLKNRGACKFCDGRAIDDQKINEIINASERFEIKYIPLDSYIDSFTPMEFLCPKCGRTFKRTVNGFITTNRKVNGCKFCETHVPFDEDILRYRIQNVDSDYDLVSFPKDFKGISRTDVPIIHKKCGKIMNMRPNNFLYGEQRCDCERKRVMFNPNHLSKGAEFIKNFLETHEIKFEMEKTFNDMISPFSDKRLRLDFYIESAKIAIEFDGKFHTQYSENSSIFSKERMEATKIRDNAKNEYCNRNGILLFRISYEEYNNLKIVSKLIEIKESIRQRTFNDYPFGSEMSNRSTAEVNAVGENPLNGNGESGIPE